MADVPNAPGVPAVAFAPDILDAGLALAAGDATGIASLFGASTWGVFSGGSPVITADTVTSVEYRQEWSISDYPLEQGAFESYDKVATPFGARVSFAAGGSEDKRMALLGSVAAIAGDLNLYDVATPTMTYPSVNVTHYDYRRTTQAGVGMLVVDVWLSEIRVTASSGSSGNNAAGNTASPSGADATNGGTVQGTDATATQSVQAGTASETAASGQSGVGAGYTGAPLPVERPATLLDSTGTGGRTI